MDDDAISVFKSVISKCKHDAQNQQAKTCWLWPDEWPAAWGDKPEGYLILRGDDGYGWFVLLGNAMGKQMTCRTAHVMSYDHRNKGLPEEFDGAEDAATSDDYLVRHTCGNPSCVKPDHLRLGDASQNMSDYWFDKFRGRPIGATAERKRGTIFLDYKVGLSIPEIADKYDRVAAWEVFNILEEAGLTSIDTHFDMRDSGRIAKDEIAGRNLQAELSKLESAPSD
jgi:HNH endonuclease